MKIAILGAGITGLTAAYCLSKKGHRITLFEKEAVSGGLASGFKSEGWDWYLERTYHHLFANDYDIINFAKEIGFRGIFFKEPETASLYSRIFPVDTPQDFLNLPLLSLPQKIRAGAVLAFLKLSPFFSFYEQQTASEFLKKTMGEKAWNVLWEQLFRKKFGIYAEKILASFIWARIKKRTKSLGYIEGGFQTFIDYLERLSIQNGVQIAKQCEVQNIGYKDRQFEVVYMDENKVEKKDIYKAVISTLPSPILLKTAGEVFPAQFTQNLRKIKYLHALMFIMESSKPVLDQTYWLNICTKDIPLMFIGQHTNFIDKKHYGGSHITYIGHYLERGDVLMNMTKEELIAYHVPLLKKINSEFSSPDSKFYIYKAPFAQPIIDKEYPRIKPDFLTPIKNFYIANLDMTYPYDRGTNFSVQLGKQVSRMI